MRTKKTELDAAEEAPSDPVEAAKVALQADMQKRLTEFLAEYQKLCEEHRCVMQPTLVMTPQGVQWSLQPTPQA